ncbi:MAG: hypothetical protein JF610_16195, partial [Acidobacteria bacterium]|nr:hypothetical protein [Acidobacteriota bacterium]
VLRYRRGYTTDPIKKPNQGRAYMPTISGVMPVADVPLRLLAIPFATATGARELMAIELRAPKSELGPEGGALSDDVTVTVAAVRSDLAKVERAFKFTRHVSITPAYAREAGDTIAYQVVRAIDLPPGPYQFRVSVTSAKMNRTGSVYLTTDVPDYRERPFDLGGPLLAFADVNKHPAAATIVDSGLPSIAPVFDRVFANGDAIRVLCPILKGTSAPTDVRIELIDDVGKIVSTTNAGIQTRGIYGVDAVLNLQGLRSGPYRLRVTASSRDATSTRETGLAIR